MMIFNDTSKDFSRCDKPGVVPYQYAEQSDDEPGHYCVQHAARLLKDFRNELCKHEGCNEPGKYNDSVGRPVCKGHYIQTHDAESAAIVRHLANCCHCDEENEVFCEFYWTASDEA
jgi:hypothetical protein